MDRLHAMRVFEQVVSESGFAAAARKLDLPPPTVTRLVKDLENHLGVQLLLRTTRRLALTPAGEAYVERVRTILGELEQAEEAVSEHAREMSGSVRVLAFPGLSTHLLAPAAAAFRLRHPKVSIDLRSDVQPALGLAEHDLALLTDELVVPADAVVRPLMTSFRVLCASPAYLARRGEPREPQELSHHEWIQLARQRSAATPLKLALDADPARQVSIEVRAILHCNDREAVLQGTLEGAGISAQTLHVAAPLMRGGQLQPGLPGWNAGQFTMLVIYATRRHMPARVRAFLEHLLQAAKAIEAGLFASADGISVATGFSLKLPPGPPAPLAFQASPRVDRAPSHASAACH